MSFLSSAPSNVANTSTASTSPFTTSPSPSSPPSSSSNSKRLSRPSLAISYSQPPPRMEPSFMVHMTPDPKLPTRASYYTGNNKRPSVTTTCTEPSSSMSISTVATNSTSREELAMKSAPKKKFVVPAHPQSHHLHTLPPREKTTRTLILDHTAWRHGRTRFAQGRCELGMKVRIKGKDDDFQDGDSNNRRPAFYIGNGSSTQSNGVSQPSRPRRYSDFGELPEVDVTSSDDEEDMAWEGVEGVSALAYGKRCRERKHRRQGLRTMSTSTTFMQADLDEDSASDYDSTEEGTSSLLYHDARFAPLFAARANGMAKVLYSILRDTATTPSGPSTPLLSSNSIAYANTQHSSQSTVYSGTSRVLPNGLRLRLALLELIDDLFERQGSASYEGSISGGQNTANETDSTNVPPLSGLNGPPAGLAALVQVSNQPFFAPPTLPSFRTLSLPSSSMTSQNRSLPSNGASSYGSSYPPFGGSGSTSRQPPMFSWTRNSTTASSPSPLNTLVRDKENASNGNTPTSPVDKVYRASPITLRGPAPDLPASWTDQVPKTVAPNTALIRRASGRAKDLYAAGCYSAPSSASNIQTFRTDIPTFSHRGTILAAPQPPPQGYPIEKLRTLCPRHLRQKCRICEPGSANQNGSTSSFPPATTRIGAGLLKKQRFLRERGGGVNDQWKRSGSVLADLLPRFLRLSALIAIELGREARGEEPEATNGQEEDVRLDGPDSSAANDIKLPMSHAQPTRAWFALLCGLITRAVLEGYFARGWKGPDYIEILMGVGLGIKGVGTRRQSSGIGDFGDDNQHQPPQSHSNVDDAPGEFDPDGMPGLVDACKILFNGLVRDAALPADSNDKSTGAAEQEYVQEMEERLSEFLGVSHPCPDLATHLTQISEKYPAEPVERAALKFCEAIARWRGKPELEMYKLSARSSAISTPALPIHALLASPAPQKPPIQHYFTVPFSARKPTSSSVRGLKRQRSVDEEAREPKKEKVESRYMGPDTTESLREDHTGGRIVEDVPDADWVGPYGI